MKITTTANVLTVVTDITKEMVEKKYVGLSHHDEKEDLTYTVAVANDGKASLSKFGFVGNSYVDGKLAAVIIVTAPAGEEVTKETVKAQYGEQLLAAKKYTAIIAEEATAKDSTLDGLFD